MQIGYPQRGLRYNTGEYVKGMRRSRRGEAPAQFQQTSGKQFLHNHLGSEPKLT